MSRLRLEDDNGGRPALRRLPEAVEAPHELIAATVSATAMAGSGPSYNQLMGLSGAAFMLRHSTQAASPQDACIGRERFLCQALADWGFRNVRLLSYTSGVAEGLAEELRASRPAVAQGCFPEAPWRAGNVTALLPDGLWTVLDCQGRVHALAPRADVLLLLGPQDERHPVSPSRLLWRCLDAWEGQGDNEGAFAWRNWIHAVNCWPHDAGDALSTAVLTHEFLYETLLDARSCAAMWLADLAAEVPSLAADWLTRAAGKIEALAELLDSRHPPVHHPDVVRAFVSPAWRRELAELLAEAAELDLSAKNDLAQAIDADYPPEED